MAVSLAWISIHSRVETDICCHDTIAPLDILWAQVATATFSMSKFSLEDGYD